MIKWLSGSRLKTGTETEPHSPYTNDPLAAVTEVTTAEGKCHIYAVSRVNPLFKEDVEGNSETLIDQRSSPRKSISSGYESRCNSSSDSSSCTECEEKRVKKSLPVVKREKRLTKQSKTDKKKRGDHSHEKWDPGQGQKHSEEGRRNSGNIKRRLAKLKNGPAPGPSILSPIPEGKIDCSIPPPIWPRFGKYNERKRDHLPDSPARIYHNGTTNPVNFMFKYNERYPKCYIDRTGMFTEYPIPDKLPLEAEYEHNWIECCRSQYGKSNYIESDEEIDGNLTKTEKGFTTDSNLERLPIDANDLTQEVLRDLANLIAYAMSRKNLVPWETILENLADSIRKSLQSYSPTASDEDEDDHDRFDRNKYLKKVLKALLSIEKYSMPSRTGEEKKLSANSKEISLKFHELSGKCRTSNAELASRRTLNDLKEDIYSSGSEGKNSTSSSSGCKDLYMSSNSSCSASKENAFSGPEFVSDGDKPYRNPVKSSEEDERKEMETNRQEDGLLNLIHHQRDFSSSSTESAFGSSDTSHPSSDSSSANGVLNPVFLHENIYSVPKSMRNALICDSYNRTKNDDCGGSIKNCGSSAFEKFISAKRKTSHDSQMEDLGPLTYPDDGKTRLSAVVATPKVTTSVVKKVEHPYYVAIGRPDFTLDLPQAEKLMKKIASSKRRRCWCRFTTSILGLLFFLLSVMMVSLVVTKGRRMFGAL